MPTRKQRRRQAKDRRHEYEYVYVDESGGEIEVDEPEKPAKSDSTASTGRRPAGNSSGKAAQSKAPAGRAPRKIDPPSWQKVFRRAAIFAPIMVVVVYLLRPKSATAASMVLQVAVLLLFFLPFSYVMDTVMYRNYRKRIGDPLPPRGRKPRSSK